MTRVLVLEHDDSSRRDLRDELVRCGFDVVEAAHLDAAQHLSAQPIDAIVANALLFAEADELLAFAGTAPVVLAADRPSISHAVECMRRGAADYLPRPLAAGALRAAVTRAADDLRRDAAAVADFSPMIGECPAMRALFKRIGKVAQTDSTVLIQGEPGTGKELVARAVHAASRRWQGRLIAMNCATVRDSLVEAELFGHPPGAASPAIRATARNAHQRGLIEVAEGGTLFIDEIGEMPLQAQTRLLRVLDEGDSVADMRLIAATHRDLAQLTETGHFSTDLLARLNLLTLHVPPLRERGDDVLAIAAAVLERTAVKQGKHGLAFAASALAALRRYSWPGNVRELEHAVERAAILCDDTAIDADLLAIDIRRAPPPPRRKPAETSGSLEDFFVRFVLENQDRYTETELASKLGISRKSLWERRQRLSIPRRRTRKRGPRRDQR